MLYTPNVDIIDSRDDSAYTYVIVNRCASKVLKSKAQR